MIKKIHLIWVGNFIPMYDKRPYLNRVLKWARLNKGWRVHLWYSSRTLDATGKEQIAMLTKLAPEISLMDCGQQTKVFVGLEDCFADELYNKFPNYGAASDILRCDSNQTWRDLLRHGHRTREAAGLAEARQRLLRQPD